MKEGFAKENGKVIFRRSLGIIKAGSRINQITRIVSRFVRRDVRI
jgi:hypothetical protein